MYAFLIHERQGPGDVCSGRNRAVPLLQNAGCRTRFAVCLLVLLPVLLWGCHKGDGSSGERQWSSHLTLTPEEEACGSTPNAMCLEQVRSDKTRLSVALKVDRVPDPIYGIAATVCCYDPEVFTYLDYEPGAFLSQGGEGSGAYRCAVKLQEGDSDEQCGAPAPGGGSTYNRLLVGASQMGDLPGLPGPGGQVVVLHFEGRKTGSCSMKIVDATHWKPDLSHMAGDEIKTFEGRACTVTGDEPPENGCSTRPAEV